MTTLTAVRIRPEAEPHQVGEAFLDAITARDFDTLHTLLDPAVEMRALLSGGYTEYHGADQVTGAYAGWLGGATRLDILAAGVEPLPRRIRAVFRVQLRRPGHTTDEILEQTAICRVRDGRISGIDMLCSGFRPLG